MSKLYYNGKPVLFKCNRKRCGELCGSEFVDCQYTTDIEYAEQALDGEYLVNPNEEPGAGLWYLAVPVREHRKEKDHEGQKG